MTELSLTIPLEPPSGNHWTGEQMTWLQNNYPILGQQASASTLKRSAASIRTKASKMGLKADRGSDFFQSWQSRAAASKVGIKRPDQSNVMAELHRSGKLKRSAEVNAVIASKVSQRWKSLGHPRGALGMKHTDIAKSAIGRKSLQNWASMTEEQKDARFMKIARSRVINRLIRIQPAGRSWKAGWREIGGQRAYFRSRWEANYARYLEWMKQRAEIAGWEHEPETFWFEGIKRGCVSYLPDFRVTLAKGVEYHEVKGWMDGPSRTKINRMRIYHPRVCLVVIDKTAYGQIEKAFSRVIEGWES